MTIRIDTASMHSLNPFGKEWLPGHGRKKRYLNNVATALFPDDVRIARIVAMVAEDLIEANGQTNLGAIRDHIASSDEKEWTRRTLTALHPITTPAARALTDTSTVHPEHLNGTGEGDDARPFTLYIVRDALADGRRHPIVAAMQTAIWHWSMSFVPGRTRDDGNRTGPCPIGCLMNDDHAMPAMPMIVEAIDLGRRTGSSIVMLGSVRTSLEARYGVETASLIRMMGGLRIMLPQSDPIQSKEMDPYDEVGHEKASALGLGEAYLLAGTGAPIPIRLPFYFEDAVWRTRGHSRGLGPHPAVDEA